MESAAGGPGPARRRLLAYQPDAAPARPAVLRLEIRGRPRHQPPRTSAGAPAPQAVPQGLRALCGWHLGAPRDHAVAEKSKNYRYSTKNQVIIDADTRLVVVVGRPLPSNRNDCKVWELSGAKDIVGNATVI